MTTGENLSPSDDLLRAVRTLVAEVDTLSKRLRSEYPTREEVQYESRKRALKTLAFGIVIIVLANLLTIQTISYCFLSPTGETHGVCNHIPGYEATLEVGNERLARFNLLLEQIANNQETIVDLEERVMDLERKTPGE
jgi:hypothetical protein